MKKALVLIGASSDMGIDLLRDTSDQYDKIITIYRKKSNDLVRAMSLCRSDIIELQFDFLDIDNYDYFNTELLNITENLEGYEIHIVHFSAPKCNNNRFHKIKWNIFQKEIDISIRSFITVSQAFLPIMTTEKKGKIVVILSYLVENIPAKYCANYITVKYALLGLMKALAAEYSDKGITVNGVSPATVDTKYIDNQPEVLVNSWIEKSPLKRKIRTDEITAMIKFLLSDKADCINGENIVISCGMMAH